MKADYLVYTYEGDDDGVLFRVLENYQAEPVFRLFSGAAGYYCRVTGIFLGHYPNRRLVLHAPGAPADDLVDAIAWVSLSNRAAGESVARLDLQVTLRVTDADGVIRFLRPHARYKSTVMSPVYERGVTLYVGSPSSRKRLRVYNKTAQSGAGGDGAGELLRVELQLRNDNADRFLALWRSQGREGVYAVWRETCAAMAHGLGDVLPVANTAHVEEPEEPEASGARYRDWIASTVIPAVSRAALTGECKEELRRLRQVLDVLD